MWNLFKPKKKQTRPRPTKKMASTTKPAKPAPTRYFAFGSNLWQAQMSQRCPSSPYTGVGRLRGFEWFINARGYANIAPTSTSTRYNPNPGYVADNCDNEVWGLVYELSSADEARLNVNEGVPYAYEKRIVPVEFWPSSSGKGAAKKGLGKPEVVEMLVYIDFQRNEGGHEPRAEYVHRMNMGIRDAVREGIPQAYVDVVLRRYIPAEREADAGTIPFARRQAAGFKDESGIIPRTGSGAGARQKEAELPERASEVCYMGQYGI